MSETPTIRLKQLGPRILALLSMIALLIVAIAEGQAVLAVFAAICLVPTVILLAIAMTLALNERRGDER